MTARESITLPMPAPEALRLVATRLEAGRPDYLSGLVCGNSRGDLSPVGDLLVLADAIEEGSTVYFRAGGIEDA